jgi:glycosyltransferase involved in cell wall biosynthesis
MPKISVITVVFNGEQMIENTIKSVIGQHFTDMEFIVIDGASTDLTIDIINKYKTDIDCIVSEKDNGIYDAMNKGVAIAKGEWISFMNAGDTFCSSESLKEFFGWESSFKDATIAYGDVNLICDNSSRILKQDTKDIRYDSICHQGQLVRRTTLLLYSGYNTKYRIYADFDFQLRTLQKDASKLVYCPVCLANYNMKGVSSQLFYHFLPEYLHIIKSVPLSKRLAYYKYAYQFALKSFLYELVRKILRWKNGN